jgi:amidase
MDLNVRRQAAFETYRKLFVDNGLDAIVMPPAPHTAVPLDSWTSATYTGIWNYLDHPAIVVPVDRVKAADNKDAVADNALFGAEDQKLYSLCGFFLPDPIWSEHVANFEAFALRY